MEKVTNKQSLTVNKVLLAKLKPGEMVQGKKHKYIVLKQMPG